MFWGGLTLAATPGTVFVHHRQFPVCLHGQLHTCGLESPRVAATSIHSLEAQGWAGSETQAAVSTIPEGVPGSDLSASPPSTFLHRLCEGTTQPGSNMAQFLWPAWSATLRIPLLP